MFGSRLIIFSFKGNIFHFCKISKDSKKLGKSYPDGFLTISLSDT